MGVWYRRPMGGSGAQPFTRQVVVRVSDELYELIVGDSKTNGRTIAQTVRFHLTRHYLPGDAG